MASAIEVIGTTELSSSASQILFSSIPQDFDDLLLVANLRADTVPSGSDLGGLFIKTNDVTSTTNVTGYGVRVLSASGTSIGSGFYGDSGAYRGCFLRYIPGGSNTAVQNMFGSLELYMPNYKNTGRISYLSTIIYEASQASAQMSVCATLAPNGPVTSIILLAQSPQTLPDQIISDFSVGSSATLYGIIKQ